MVPVFPVLLFCLFLLHFESVSWDVCGRGTVPPCRECLFTAAANPALPTARCGVSLGLATSGCVSGPSKPVSLHTSWSLCCGSRLTVMCQQQSQVTGLSPPELKSTTALPLSGCPFLLVGVFNHTLVSTGESSVTHSPAAPDPSGSPHIAPVIHTPRPRATFPSSLLPALLARVFIPLTVLAVPVASCAPAPPARQPSRSCPSWHCHRPPGEPCSVALGVLLLLFICDQVERRESALAH